MGLFDFGKAKEKGVEILLNKMDKVIALKKAELESLNKQLELTKFAGEIERAIANRQRTLDELKEEIRLANDTLEMQEFGFFERRYNFSDAIKYKDALDTLRMSQKDMVKNGHAGKIISPMLLDNSQSKGKAMQNQLIKAAIRGFNGEADALLVKVTVSNVDKKVQALRKSFEQINKMYQRNMIQLTFNYLESKIEELHLAAEYELQKQKEKELLREQREKEREDKKLQAEIKAQKKKIEKDRNHFKNMIQNVNELLRISTEAETKELMRQLNEYQNKLIELDELEEEVDYRESNATAGYVYVISNIGSFGEDVYKIGVTRRLEPLERIRELSSASVPFQFDVHALIFSEQAFALETELHNTFEQYKLNKVNGRKEYFKVPFTEIKKVLESHSELTLELTEQAEAFEYRQSLNKENTAISQ